MCDCSGHCTVTEYRQSAIVLTTWSGVTDKGEDVGSHPIDKKWKWFDEWQRAFVAGLAAHWSRDDDCDDDCDCYTDANPPSNWKDGGSRKFRQPVAFPGYRSFFIHGTYALEYRTTEGVCSGDLNDEEEGRALVCLSEDAREMAVVGRKKPRG